MTSRVRPWPSAQGPFEIDSASFPSGERSVLVVGGAAAPRPGRRRSARWLLRRGEWLDKGHGPDDGRSGLKFYRLAVVEKAQSSALFSRRIGRPLRSELDVKGVSGKRHVECHPGECCGEPR